jgi:hypothetical protein
MTAGKFQRKIILIGAVVFIVLLPSLGAFFGMKDFGMLFYITLPVISAFLFFELKRSGRRSGSPGRSNPHINRELTGNFERIEDLEEFERRPDRDKRIPGFVKKDR